MAEAPPMDASGAQGDADRRHYEAEKAAAAEEWAAVEQRQNEREIAPGASVDKGESALVSFADAVEHFRTQDMSEYSKNVPPPAKPGLLARLLPFLGPPKLSPSLASDRDLIFAIAKCPFDNNSEMHNRMLQTIYKRLTGSAFDCPRYGNHWEIIGFQGQDPSTDLRAMGMLGLLTLLFFVDEVASRKVALKIYQLSRDERQAGKLNKELNAAKSVATPFGEAYAGIYYSIYIVWKNQQKTIKDSGFVLKDAEANAGKSMPALMRQLRTAVARERLPDDVTA